MSAPHGLRPLRLLYPERLHRAQLLEANASLQRILTEIPLTDDEQAAVDDDRAALARLLDRLADTPTPAGPTPRQIGVPPTATLLPIVSLRHAREADGS